MCNALFGVFLLANVCDGSADDLANVLDDHLAAGDRLKREEAPALDAAARELHLLPAELEHVRLEQVAAVVAGAAARLGELGQDAPLRAARLTVERAVFDGPVAARRRRLRVRLPRGAQLRVVHEALDAVQVRRLPETPRLVELRAQHTTILYSL